MAGLVPPPAVCAGGVTGAAGGSAARAAPVRDDALAESASRPGGEADSGSAGSGGAGTTTASARTPSATAVPGSGFVSCTALAAVSGAAASGAAGSGGPKIHAASAHNTMLKAKTRIPESRVMALPFVAGVTSDGHDSPIGRRCTGMRRPCRRSLQIRMRPVSRRSSTFGPPAPGFIPTGMVPGGRCDSTFGSAAPGHDQDAYPSGGPPRFDVRIAGASAKSSDGIVFLGMAEAVVIPDRPFGRRCGYVRGCRRSTARRSG